MSKTVETWIAIPDVHIPFHNVPALRATEKFMADLQPDGIVYMGDLGDYKVIKDVWEGKKAYSERHYTSIIDDHMAVEEMLDRQKKLCGNKVKRVYLEGNHEARIRRFICQVPMADRSNLLLEEYFQFDKQGIKFYPMNIPAQLGKLYLLHGVYHSKYHSNQHVVNYHRNIMYGHTHDRQIYTEITPIDVEDVHTGQSIGCLCNKNPDYTKFKPNRWVHGFSVIYVHKNGSFNDYFVKITRGRFMYGGKVYG